MELRVKALVDGEMYRATQLFFVGVSMQIQDFIEKRLLLSFDKFTRKELNRADSERRTSKE